MEMNLWTVLLVVLVVVAVAECSPKNSLVINQEWNDDWALYKARHEKNYEPMEEFSRRLIWEQNLKYIQEHNLRYDLGQHSYFLGVNQFTDMTNEEFRAKYLSLKKPGPMSHSMKYMAPLNMGQLPANVNWVTKGYVTPVKNQAQCGSCWAFSTTGSVEGQYFRKNKKLLSFSEQQLVDCSDSFGNNGCNGGLMDNAFKYIRTFGIEKEQDYPYTARDGNCNYEASEVVTKISGHVDVPQGDEDALASAVATQGPISVAIDAGHISFQLYKGGVYDEPQCSSTNLDHGVLAAGYGIQVRKKYWLVKNSWGEGWGMAGYIRMSKDKNNQCGIATMASYPTM